MRLAKRRRHEAMLSAHPDAEARTT
jgi:hypothetical protein